MVFAASSRSPAVRGENLNGTVCAFGADFQIIRPNALIELEAKYVSGLSIESEAATRHCEERQRRSNPSLPRVAAWIASRSLSSGAHSRDPLARNDVARARRPPVPWSLP